MWKNSGQMENKLQKWNLWEPVKERELPPGAVLEQIKDYIGHLESWAIVSALPCIFCVMWGQTMTSYDLLSLYIKQLLNPIPPFLPSLKHHQYCYLCSPFLHLSQLFLYSSVVTHWGGKQVFIKLFVVFATACTFLIINYTCLERKLFQLI